MRLKISTILVSVVFSGLGSIFPAFGATQPIDIDANAQNKATQVQALPVADVQRFAAAIADVKKYYVTDVSDEQLFNNALQGMMAGLDPHSTYLDTEDYAALNSITSGEFGGLGIEIGSEDGYIRIVSPIDDTPAQKAGLKSGDYIIKIDNESVQDMDLRDAVAKMRGKPGSTIVLTIYRKNEKVPFNVTLTREVIHVQSVKSRILDHGYGYIRISQFQMPTIDDLNVAMKKLKAQNDGKNLSGLILDLRNNPGGLLDSAVGVSDAFLDSNKLDKNDLIVYTKGRIKGSQLEAHATPGDLLNGAPIVVLVNGGSASASEIVAGALQDQRRAIIMGTQTFGKGSVQTVLPLDEQTGIKITTALYYTPDGRSIQAKGITPDVVVDLMEVKASKDTDNMNMVVIKEQDLAAHLANGNQHDKSAPATVVAAQTAPAVLVDKDKAAKDAQPLAVTDYQLNEALNLLKGLNAVAPKREAAT